MEKIGNIKKKKASDNIARMFAAGLAVASPSMASGRTMEEAVMSDPTLMEQVFTGKEPTIKMMYGTDTIKKLAHASSFEKGRSIIDDFIKKHPTHFPGPGDRSDIYDPAQDLLDSAKGGGVWAGLKDLEMSKQFIGYIESKIQSVNE